MKIRKKVQKNYFEDVLAGKKRFEVRLADFDCQSGDTIVLQEQKQGSDRRASARVVVGSRELCDCARADNARRRFGAAQIRGTSQSKGSFSFV